MLPLTPAVVLKKERVTPERPGGSDRGVRGMESPVTRDDAQIWSSAHGWRRELRGRYMGPDLAEGLRVSEVSRNGPVVQIRQIRYIL